MPGVMSGGGLCYVVIMFRISTTQAWIGKMEIEKDYPRLVFQLKQAREGLQQYGETKGMKGNFKS